MDTVILIERLTSLAPGITSLPGTNHLLAFVTIFSTDYAIFHYISCFYVYCEMFTSTANTVNNNINNHQIFIVTVTCKTVRSVRCVMWHYNRCSCKLKCNSLSDLKGI